VNSTKYHRIYLLLKDAIERGQFEPGVCLPGELALSQKHQVSRITVRRAMAALAEEGLVARRVGVGTVVAPPKTEISQITADVSNLLPNFVRMSNESSIRLLEFAYRQASPAIAAKLKLAARERVQYSVRVRSMQGNPFSYLVTHVPESIAQTYNEAELSNTSLFVLLERGGVKVDHATQTISAVLATEEMADALGVSVGAPLIALQRVVFDVDGRGVEHLDAFYRPDRYRIQVDLGREGEARSRYWAPLAKRQGRLDRRRVSKKVP
jgi:GntR family transcriptional regulator